MKHTFPGLLLVGLGSLIAGCGIDQDAATAPTDAILTIRTDASFVALSGTTLVTVELKRTSGTAAPEGTEITLSASAGEFDQTKVRTRSGIASAVYRANATAGTVRMTATAGSLTAELSLRVGSAPPGNLTVVANPLVLGPTGGDAEVVATVSASNGALVSGVPVKFSTSAGSLSTTDAVSNDRGEARATLRTTAQATVTASVQGLTAETTVRLKQGVTIRVSTSPVEPTAGQAATVSAAISTTSGQPPSGRLRFLFGDGQSRDLGTVGASASTSYTWASQGGYNVSAEFTDGEGFTTRETIRVTVSAGAGSPSPTPSPTPTPQPNSGDQIDPRQITWLHQDVSGWPVTSRVTDVTVTRSEICVDHTGAGRFPTSQFGTIIVEGNVWVFAQINGRWYGATYDWLRPGQVCKGVTGGELGPDQIRIAPMDGSWPGPRSGDMVGFMVSARARDDVPAGQERTNIILVRWP